MSKTIYICYFGLRQPLVQTQVIPYLREIAKDGIEVTLLTFEPDPKSAWTAQQIELERAQLRSDGIDWHFLTYHKRPSALATSWDILAGALWLRSEINGQNIDVLHGRAHVASLMGAFARKLSRHRPKLIFDIRGFMPEEYTDAGVWPENGAIYRAAKRAERWLMKVSDGFVVLTEKARQLVLNTESRPVEVIPCCVDFHSRFTGDVPTLRKEMRSRLRVNGRRVFVHLGALGGLYLTKDLVDFIALARQKDPSTFAMFLTQTDGGGATDSLRTHGFTESDFLVTTVPPAQVPAYLAASDAGLSFVKATYSTQSRSPTKIPEYLAAGLPIIANSGVGDVDELIQTEGVGVLIDEFTKDAYANALEELEQLGDISAKCSEVSHRRFDLSSVGGERYRRLYKRLLQT